MLPYYRMGAYLYRRSRARLGLNAARMAYANRRALYRLGRGAARRAGGLRRRMANRRSGGARMQGDKLAGPSNQAFYDDTGAPNPDALSTTYTLNRKTMYAATIQIAKPPSNTELLGQPSRNQIRLKGLKVCFNIENTSFVTQDVYTVHIAIVQPKAFGTTGFDNANFFSNPGGGNAGLDRTKDFQPFTSVPETDFSYNCNGINRSKWNIITHTKKCIVAKGSTNPSGRTYWRYEKYFTMKGKRIMWDTITEVNISRPLYFLCWYERTFTATDQENADMIYNFNTISYFSDN